MLPQAADRIAETVPDDAVVLQVGATAGDAYARADWVLDDAPHEPHGGARFGRRTWVTRDVCGRERWPFEDGRFAFAVCTALVAYRDPVFVCAELARVARAGYVEVPSIEAELAGGDGRWLVEPTVGRSTTGEREAELVFVHKPREAHTDPRLRVGPRRLAALGPADRVHGLFWEGRLPARERLAGGPELADELAERLRRRFEPSSAEVALTEARRLGGSAAAEVARRLDALRHLR